MASTAAANQAIFDRLSGMSRFHPATANLFADWTLDPGDVVTVRQGQTDYTVPIYQMNLDWRGKPMVEVQSTGSEKRPPLSALKRNSYGSGKRQEEQEKELIRHRADIETNNERILLWATEEEWSEIAGEYQTTHNSQYEINAYGISSLVTGIDAGTFKESNAYAVGDVTVRNGKVYVFRTAHAANTPWDPTEVQEALNLYGSVKNHSTRIQQTESKIALVVDDNGIRRGQIVLAINGDGGSEALIQADQIQITGNTTLSGTMEIDGDGILRVKRNLIVNGNNGRQISMNNGTISANDLSVKSGGTLTFVGTATGEHYDLSASTFPNFIRNAQVSGNTLQLWKVTDSDASPSITFNKAVSLSGGWDGSGTYSVQATSGTISGTVPSTTPGLRLNGNGTAANFSAELLSDESSPTVQKYVYGYLHQDGNSVGVYKTYSGGVYGDIIAQIAVSGGSGSVSLSGAWDGNGTYTVAATSGSISGTIPSTTPSLRLDGNGTAANFSAELWSDASTPVKQASIYGYLGQGNGAVRVYRNSSLTDPIAMISITQGAPVWSPTPGSSTLTAAARFTVTDSAGASVGQTLGMAFDSGSQNVYLYKSGVSPDNRLARVDMSSYVDSARTVTPSVNAISVTPATGNIGIESVTVDAIAVSSSSQPTAPSGKTTLGELTSNGYYDVGSDGYVQVNVPTTQTSLSGSWSGSAYVVSATPSGQSFSIDFDPNSGSDSTWGLETGTGTLNANNRKWLDFPVYIGSVNPSGPMTRSVTINSSINATPVYEAGEADGNTAAGVQKGTWSGGTLTVSRVANTALKTTTIQLGAGTVTWNGATASVPILDGSATAYTASVTAPLETPSAVTPGRQQQTVSPSGSNIGLTGVTVRGITLGSKADSPPSGYTLMGAWTQNGYYTVGGDGYVRVNVPTGGGTITGMYATAITGSYYDQTEGYWFGDTTIHYELSGDSTDHTETLTINVQEPINKGVNAGWTQAAQQTVWPAAGSGSSFAVTVADGTWGTTTGKTFSLNASNGTIYVNDGTNNVAQIAAGGSYSFSCTEQAATWSQSISGYLNCGTISKSSVQANAYLRFRIKCDNAYKYCYIIVNP